MARAQAPELQANIGLRPAPIQSDTFAAPERPVKDDSLFRLADALSSFSSSVGSLAGLTKPTQKERQDSAWAEQRRFSGWTRDDYVQAVEAGQIPNYDNEFTQKAIQASFGSEYGGHRVSQLKEALANEFDWNNGDVDAYIAAAVQEDIEKYGSDRNFGGAYLRQMEGLRTWALDYREKRKQSQFVEAQNRAAFGFIDTVVDHGINTGTDPEQIAGEIFKNYSDLGKDGTLGVDFKQLDQEVLNKARRIAGTAPEVALALIESERKGSDGTIRSFSTNPDMRDTVLQIRATAAKAISDRSESEMLEALAQEDVALLREGNLDTVDDIDYTTLTGEEKTLSGKKRRRKATQGFLEQSARIAEGNRESGGERLSRELRAFRLSGEKHPQLEEQVTGIADMASIDMLQDEPARGKMIQKLETYKWMQNESTNSVLAYTKAPDRELAETYLMAERYLGQDQETALGTAIRATQLTKEGAPGLSRNEVQQLEDEVDSLIQSEGFISSIFGMTEAPANFSIVEQNVSRLATVFMRAGLKPELAVEQAAAAVENTTVAYNGVVLDLQGHDIPDNFRGSVDLAIQDFAASNPLTLKRNDIEKEDLSIAPAHSGSAHGGRFMLIDRNTMMPVMDDKGNGTFITLKDLRRDAQAKKYSRDIEIAREAAFKSSTKSRSLDSFKDSNGNTVWYNKKTREIYEYSFGQGEVSPRWKKTGKRMRWRRDDGKTPDSRPDIGNIIDRLPE